MAKANKAQVNAKEQAKVTKENKAAAAKQKKQKNQEKVKRSRAKETMSELKKVSWPSFGKVMKQTGMVISVVLIFMLLIVGIDQLLIWLLSLCS